MSADEVVFKILLIDDDMDFVNITKTVLESNPRYKVLTASNGIFGLSLAKAEKPDIIILDVIMPFEDGFTVANELKNHPDLRAIPVIVLTSFSNRKGETDISVARGMELETEDYIEKPVEPEELLRRVDKLLNPQ